MLGTWSHIVVDYLLAKPSESLQICSPDDQGRKGIKDEKVVCQK